MADVNVGMPSPRHHTCFVIAPALLAYARPCLAALAMLSLSHKYAMIVLLRHIIIYDLIFFLIRVLLYMLFGLLSIFSVKRLILDAKTYAMKESAR